MSYPQLRGQRFRRLFRDVYVSADLPQSLHLRCRAATLLLPPEPVFCGLTAARLYDLPVPDGDDRVHVAVPTKSPTSPRHRDMNVHRLRLPPEQICLLHGVNVVSPEWLFIELAATLGRVDRVVLGDAILRRQLTSTAVLTSLAQQNPGRRGVLRAKDTLPLLEPNADSPMETRLRLIIVDAGLPRPIANAMVFDDWGQWIAQPDLLYPEARIAIEYEGAHHRTDARQFSNDIGRGDLLAEQGYLLLRYDAHHVYRTPHRIVGGVRTALNRRLPAANGRAEW